MTYFLVLCARWCMKMCNICFQIVMLSCIGWFLVNLWHAVGYSWVLFCKLNGFWLASTCPTSCPTFFSVMEEQKSDGLWEGADNTLEIEGFLLFFLLLWIQSWFQRTIFTSVESWMYFFHKFVRTCSLLPLS